MSAYELQKFIWQLDRDRQLKGRFRENPEAVIDERALADEEKVALREVNAWALRELGVHAILIRQYTRMFQIPHGAIFQKQKHRQPGTAVQVAGLPKR